MKLLGITGGVGMGKSAVSQLLCDRGLPVIDTDVLAREIVKPGAPALRELQSAFGTEIVFTSGELQRQELARIVFADANARKKLEGILHPRIRDLWKQQVEDWRAERQSIAFVVIPLLFETSAESEFDVTICVACSTETQRKRLQARGWSKDQIDQRIAAQWPIEKKMLQADYVIWTEGRLGSVVEQLDKILS
jgi:dephospho-CoA kinase